MRRAASLESQQQLPEEGANEARSPSDPARVVDASSPDAPKALKVWVHRFTKSDIHLHKQHKI